LDELVTLYSFVLVVATFLCSLVAGFLFAFAIVVMPGIRRLDDGDFIRAFQAMDRVIQNNQPLFVIVWAGSVLAVAAAAILAVREVRGLDLLLVITAALVYFLGVQAPTVRINVPLNNALQKLDPAGMDDQAGKRARSDFEPRWNRWNVIRMACSGLASLLLLLVVLRT
jgi:uncharacterized membrane protein